MADLVLVDPDATRDIRGDGLHSKCGWTPFEGMTGVFPELTMVRGHVVYEDPEASLTPDGVGPADGAFGAAAGENVRE